jgi:F-type H+-transporting ATPase subunit gamma
MATLIDFRRRIRSVKNTQQITRAMKFVSAARLRRAQERVMASRPYAREILSVLRSARSRMEEITHPLLKARPEERLLVIILSGDKGLCGAFNANVLRKAVEFLREHHAQPMQIVAVGKKSRDALRKRKLDIAAEFLNVSLRVEFRHAKEIAARAVAGYSAEEVDAVYLIYNEFKNVMTQKLVVSKLLPIEPATFDSGANPVDYIYEQPAAEIFDHMVPRYVEGEVFRALLESAAAEHSARMTAMDSATNNAADLIESITMHMNKVRQAAITKEIIEVVSGAASAG